MGLFHLRPTLAAVSLLAMLAPLAPATATTADPDRLLDVELDDVILGQGSQWVAENPTAPLNLRALVATPGEPQIVTLPIGGIEVFGYEARLTGGTLVVSVDGVAVHTLGPGEHVEDVALGRYQQALTWEFIPAEANDSIDLVFRGARALLAPVLGYLDQYVVSNCGDPPELWIRFRFAAPLAAVTIEIMSDGERIEPTVYTWIAGGKRTFQAEVELPREEEGALSEVTAVVRDAAGRIWPVVVNKPVEHVLYAPISAGPNGIVYNLHPRIWLSSPCFGTSMDNIRFYLDGVDRTSELICVSEGGAVFVLPDELRYGMSHSWRYELTLRDGTPQAIEGIIRGGLDVLEWEVPALALVWTEASYQWQNEPPEGYTILADLTDPITTPLVYAETREIMTDGAPPVVHPEGAKLRAVYAPEGLSCDRRAVSCSPYDGEAPGWTHFRVATLTVTGNDGRITVLDGAGQFAAASRITKLGELQQEYVEGGIAFYTAWADGMVRLAHQQAHWALWYQEYLRDWTLAFAHDRAADSGVTI